MAPPADPSGKRLAETRKAPQDARTWQLGEPGDARLRIAGAGQPGLLLEGATERRVTLLDSLDWLLLQAGWLLLSEGEGEAASLTLLSLDGSGAPRHLPWSGQRAFAWELPQGALAKRLANVLGPRRALPRGVLQIERQGFRLVGEGRQVLAELAAESTTVTPLSPDTGAEQPSFALPDRLSLEVAAGNEDSLARLCAALGLSAASQAARGLLAEAAERLHETAPLPERSGLSRRGEAAAPALCRLLAQEGRFLEAWRPGVLADLDSECLHDLRIATRRARSLLRCFGEALPKRRRQALAERLGWLGKITGPTRDLDVLWLYLAGIDEGVTPPPAELRSLLGPVQARIEVLREESLRALGHELTRPRFEKLLTALAAAPPEASADAKAPDLGALAQHQIGKALQRVLNDGDAIDSASPPEVMHDLRKDVKRLRYSLDAGANLLAPSKSGERLVRRLKDLQTLLGHYQDCEVFAEALDKVAKAKGEPLPQDSLIALGRLIERLEAERQEARDGFARAFRRFSRVARRWSADAGLDGH